MLQTGPVTYINISCPPSVLCGVNQCGRCTQLSTKHCAWDDFVLLKKNLTFYVRVCAIRSLCLTHYVGVPSHPVFRGRNQSLQDRSVFILERVIEIGYIAAKRSVSSSGRCLNPCSCGLAEFSPFSLLQLISLQACIRLTCCTETNHQYEFCLADNTATTEMNNRFCNALVSLQSWVGLFSQRCWRTLCICFTRSPCKL